MFAYCLNDPVCMADYKGKDAIYVVDTSPGDGLIIVGHAILFVQDEEGNWYRTDYRGKFPYKSTARIEIDPISEEDIQKFLNQGNKKSIYIKGDFSASYKLAKEYEGTNYGGYCFLTNNCLHYVKELIQAASPANPADHISAYSGDFIPIVFYSTIMNNRAKMIQQEITRLIWRRIGSYACQNEAFS